MTGGELGRARPLHGRSSRIPRTPRLGAQERHGQVGHGQGSVGGMDGAHPGRGAGTPSAWRACPVCADVDRAALIDDRVGAPGVGAMRVEVDDVLADMSHLDAPEDDLARAADSDGAWRRHSNANGASAILGQSIVVPGTAARPAMANSSASGANPAAVDDTGTRFAMSPILPVKTSVRRMFHAASLNRPSGSSTALPLSSASRVWNSPASRVDTVPARPLTPRTQLGFGQGEVRGSAPAIACAADARLRRPEGCALQALWTFAAHARYPASARVAMPIADRGGTECRPLERHGFIDTPASGGPPEARPRVLGRPSPCRSRRDRLWR